MRKKREKKTNKEAIYWGIIIILLLLLGSAFLFLGKKNNNLARENKQLHGTVEKKDSIIQSKDNEIAVLQLLYDDCNEEKDSLQKANDSLTTVIATLTSRKAIITLHDALPITGTPGTIANAKIVPKNAPGKSTVHIQPVIIHDNIPQDTCIIDCEEYLCLDSVDCDTVGCLDNYLDDSLYIDIETEYHDSLSTQSFVYLKHPPAPETVNIRFDISDPYDQRQLRWGVGHLLVATGSFIAADIFDNKADALGNALYLMEPGQIDPLDQTSKHYEHNLAESLIEDDIIKNENISKGFKALGYTNIGLAAFRVGKAYFTVGTRQVGVKITF